MDDEKIAIPYHKLTLESALMGVDVLFPSMYEKDHVVIRVQDADVLRQQYPEHADIELMLAELSEKYETVNGVVVNLEKTKWKRDDIGGFGDLTGEIKIWDSAIRKTRFKAAYVVKFLDNVGEIRPDFDTESLFCREPSDTIKYLRR